jgi:preprotein translocase subunit SecG
LALWQLEESEDKKGHWTSGKAADALKQAICKEILHLLTAILFPLLIICMIIITQQHTRKSKLC